MADFIKHKGFKGTVAYSAADKCLHGRIVGIPDTVIYGGNDLIELVDSFNQAVDEYIKDCERLGKPVKKTYSGHFSIRIKPILHRKFDYLAASRKTSVSKIIEKVMSDTISSETTSID